MSTTTQLEGKPPARIGPASDQNGRLFDIVGELLLANQELRFKVAQLEQEVAQVSEGLNHASAIYGMLLP